MSHVTQDTVADMSFAQLLEFLQSGCGRDARTVEVYDAVNVEGVFDRFDDEQQYRLDMAWAAVLRARMALVT